MRPSAADSNEFGDFDVKSSGMGAFSNSRSFDSRAKTTANMADLIAD
jgi:hypothetical protein